ncbi:tRNA pseudouridine(55) synthase TruB [Glaciihabitans arcticus]|uniref:tRNA pseudouridine synthase B n=1 Tax=Glaciihabitans arcticus TaxID=2668039 RepID=A0A4Q9GUW8_9MICO|nr:tRNA pseudouridine(55) synthase TruB [Glaciihabitans arcticus]TBN56373.1 tRNA pseudouridine(55) synthase TruB [Glaciihabitans arcticus]
MNDESGNEETSGSRSGILLVDKPQGITSHGVVSRTRKAAGTRKVGHAGTLDPMATGLLLLGLNSSTRLLTFLVGLDKEYFATIRLGLSTTTDDAEGEPLEQVDASGVEASAVASGIAKLTGDIEQVPSSVSAIKVDGKRAYALVREGHTVDLKARAVTIKAFEILETRRDGSFTDVDVRVECTSGTYIRALARDLGSALGVGGHLTALRRTRIGPFDVKDAAELDDLAPASQLIAPAAIAETLFPTFTATDAEVIHLVHGKRIRIPAAADDNAPVAVLAPDGRLVGLVTVLPGSLKDGTGLVKPLVNFPTDEVIGVNATESGDSQ